MADQVVIRETLSITTQNITEEDKVLGQMYNKVAMKALKQADHYLRKGPDDARLAITKAFMSSIARLSAIDSKTQIDESREALFSTMDKITAIEESRPVVTASSILDSISHDPLPKALDRRSDDQDIDS